MVTLAFILESAMLDMKGTHHGGGTRRRLTAVPRVCWTKWPIAVQLVANATHACVAGGDRARPAVRGRNTALRFPEASTLGASGWAPLE
jgi:hypothetical protein